MRARAAAAHGCNGRPFIQHRTADVHECNKPLNAARLLPAGGRLAAQDPGDPERGGRAGSGVEDEERLGAPVS
jgi:hypothetical protein